MKELPEFFQLPLKLDFENILQGQLIKLYHFLVVAANLMNNTQYDNTTWVIPTTLLNLNKYLLGDKTLHLHDGAPSLSQTYETFVVALMSLLLFI